jgi:phosphoglycerate dehydrogenase-like enzyme
MAKPIIAVLSGEELFGSFFDSRRKRRLARLANWTIFPGFDLRGRVRAELANVEGLITTWDSPYLSAEMVRQMPKLRIIAHCGGEVKKRFERSLFNDLTITNASMPMARPTAELGATLLMYSARNVDYYRRQLRKRSNRIYTQAHINGGTEESLLGREVGMIGFGRVGRAVVEMLRGFDVKWRVYDPFASRTLTTELPIKFDSLDRVLRRSSLLLLTASLTDKTRGMLNAGRLSTLPDGATVINVARGGLIDLEALTREVASGRLRCAIDVTDPAEPLPIGHPLRTLPGALVTPHIGGGGQRTRGEMTDEVLDELQRFFAGEAVKNRVTLKMLSRMT